MPKPSDLGCFHKSDMNRQQCLQMLDTKKPTVGLYWSFYSIYWNVLVTSVSCKKSKKTLFPAHHQAPCYHSSNVSTWPQTTEGPLLVLVDSPSLMPRGEAGQAATNLALCPCWACSLSLGLTSPSVPWVIAGLKTKPGKRCFGWEGWYAKEACLKE